MFTKVILCAGADRGSTPKSMNGKRDQKLPRPELLSRLFPQGIPSLSYLSHFFLFSYFSLFFLLPPPSFPFPPPPFFFFFFPFPPPFSFFFPPSFPLLFPPIFFFPPSSFFS